MFPPPLYHRAAAAAFFCAKLVREKTMIFLENARARLFVKNL
jgi:hypothetical protein